LIYDNYGYETQILAASVRHTMHIIDCAKLGADVMGPLSSIEGLLKHLLTDIGLAKFLTDYQKETLKRFLLFNTKAEILS
jgi:transaldolase